MRSLLLALALVGAGAGTAGATQVSYIDGGQVWVATLDGAAKRSLSGPSPDAYTWSQQAQSDDGYVIAYRWTPGNYVLTGNAGQEWGPDGAPQTSGDNLAQYLTGATGDILPVHMNLAPGGAFFSYGYSNYQYAYPVGTLRTGTYARGVSWVIRPLDISGVEWPGLAGDRIVGVQSDQVVVQDSGPMQPDVTPWPGFSVPSGYESNGIDASADGRVVAFAIDPRLGDGSRGDGIVAMQPVSGGLGAAPTDDDDLNGCLLPVQGDADEVNVSADGRWLAWHDGRGVVVAGAPVWFPSAEVTTCNLSSPPVVISATGRSPQLGASTAATPPPAPPAPNPPGSGTPAPPARSAPGGGSANPGTGSTKPGAGAAKPGTRATAGKPKATVAATVRAAAFSKGLPLTVTVPAKGTVTATAKVGRTVLATTSKKAKRAGRLTFTLKASKRTAARLERYRGKTLVITIKAPGGTVAIRRTLR
ncbi:hypothetical protein [Conexibacter sp. CPCC 206217]|uniref:hypothetical protein n=1 Tax=Conexibacter sp. CPCC 206217 TaxID=3064574 RepID=UPI00271CB81C|nr:hypothetical protein [Conexibacter sp. CPCC 206217]MDO8210217.1 hypothetical protein [Conexibacter sp. CPCC 206217]